jgi:5-methylcytosine-specific restriction endonuclease McrA
MKSCPECNEVKPLTDFHKDKSKRDGAASYCKPCAKNKARKWECANRDRKNANSRASYQKNIEKQRERSKAKYLANRDYYRSYHDEWYADDSNKLRKALNRGRRVAESLGSTWHDISAERQYAYWEANGISKDHCHYCEKHFGAIDRSQISIDHVEALSNSGPHVVENIVPACTSCNSSKNDREVSEMS